MADETLIISGSYKNFPFSINGASLEGGRKTAIKQFPNRNTQNVEDLGLQPRRYTLDLIIGDKADGESYFSYRDRLLAVLEQKGPGVLIHPLYGRIENIVAVAFSLNESLSEFGDATVTVNFEPDQNTGIPQGFISSITEIGAANQVVQAAVASDVSDNYSVTDAFTGNFQAAVDKVNAIIARVNESSEFIGEAAVTLDEFSAEIGELSANVNSLVSAPLELSQAITNLFESVNGLYQSADATFDTFIGFFGFGDNDIPSGNSTSGLAERQQNNDVLNGAVAAASLAYAYQAAAGIDFQTTLDIDTVADQLDVQYQAVLASGSDRPVIDAVTDMRIKTLNAFDQARINASQIITVETGPTTVRLLAFSYYGNDDNGETIQNLNGITDVSFIEGEVQVLTA